jgi:hypothetical protein
MQCDPFEGIEMAKKTEVPNTVTDQQMRDLQDRARKANPTLDSFSDPDAVRRRLQTREQAANAKWS